MGQKPSTAKVARHSMPELAPETIGLIASETLLLAGQPLLLARPEAPDLLLDLGDVAVAYKQDEYMPYWATLWPVATYLAEAILTESWAPGLKALELGCGLGLPGVAALLSGLEVVFSDYDATALRFAAENARLNGFAGVSTLLHDWREPLEDTFDVIIASDLLYEQRNIAPLIASFTHMLAPRGIVMLADQDRPYAAEFRTAAQGAGFVVTQEQVAIDASRGRTVAGSVYKLTRATEEKRS